jgi:hypothetical protein
VFLLFKLDSELLDLSTPGEKLSSYIGLLVAHICLVSAIQELICEGLYFLSSHFSDLQRRVRYSYEGAGKPEYLVEYLGM